MTDPTLIGVQMTDEGGKVRNAVIPIQAGATLAQIQTYVDGLLDPFDNVVGGLITGVTVTVALDLDGMVAGKGAAVIDHPIKHGGLLAFAVTGTKYRHSLFVPTYARTLIDANESIANAGDTATWVTALLAGSAGVVPCDMSGRALASFLSGKSSDRK